MTPVAAEGTKCVQSSEGERQSAFLARVQRTIFVDELPPSVTDEVLKSAFQQFGVVLSVHICKEILEPSKSAGCAFVEVASSELAHKVRMPRLIMRTLSCGLSWTISAVVVILARLREHQLLSTNRGTGHDLADRLVHFFTDERASVNLMPSLCLPAAHQGPQRKPSRRRSWPSPCSCQHRKARHVRRAGIPSPLYHQSGQQESQQSGRGC